MVILDLNELTSRRVNNIFQQLGPDLQMKFLQLLTIISSSYINNINVNNNNSASVGLIAVLFSYI